MKVDATSLSHMKIKEVLDMMNARSGSDEYKAYDSDKTSSEMPSDSRDYYGKYANRQQHANNVISSPLVYVTEKTNTYGSLRPELLSQTVVGAPQNVVKYQWGDNNAHANERNAIYNYMEVTDNCDTGTDGHNKYNNYDNDGANRQSHAGSITDDSFNGALEKAILELGLPLAQLDTCFRDHASNIPRKELANEKRRVKDQLRLFNSSFLENNGVPPSKEEKEVMRPLYTYYKRLSMMIQGGSENEKEQIKAPVLSSINISEKEIKPQLETSRSNLIGHGEMTAEEKLQILHYKKLQIKQQLRDYQILFLEENNRRVKYRKDILPVQDIYKKYKVVKDKISKYEMLVNMKND